MHMDSFKTLRDENEALLKEVVGAKAARMEAKAAKEQMRRFRDEYGKRFAVLKEALEKHRREYPPDAATNGRNPVASSEFARIASAASEQLAKQEQLIKKLTSELKKEKEESKKKDSALLKYESFYREVKARSAAKQRQKELGQQQNQQQAQRSSLQSRPASKPNLL
jgi:DNA repair exonuclease SbcCD ATPase subunit